MSGDSALDSALDQWGWLTKIRFHVPPTEAEEDWLRDVNRLFSQLHPDLEITESGEMGGVWRVQPSHELRGALR